MFIIILCNTPVQTHFLKSLEMLAIIQSLASLKKMHGFPEYLRGERHGGKTGSLLFSPFATN